MTPERTERIRLSLQRRQPDLVLVMEEIEDPHNIAAVMRSCDSVGVQDLFIIAKDTERYNYFGIQSSSSANRWVTAHIYNNVNDAVAELRRRGLKLMATHMYADAVSLYEMDLTAPIALAFGNERKGISEELLSHCDGNFRIPHMGMIQALNISVACAVSLYEAFRQRDQAGMYDGGPKLDAALSESLRQAWSKKLRKNE